MYSSWLLFDKTVYIRDQLDLSWGIAYAEDPSILKQLQDQWQCQGFYSLYDRPVLMKEAMDSSCYPILSQNFGSTLYVWGIKLWIFKLIQVSNKPVVVFSVLIYFEIVSCIRVNLHDVYLS